MISAVIITFNEEKKLEDCLKSVRKNCGEIILLDLGSADQTLEIAKKYRAKIFKHQFVKYVEKVRNYAVSQASGDWVLVLDPDERVGEQLWIKILKIVKDDDFDAVNIPRKNVFFGRWIKHSNWWPDKHIRLFKKGTVQWSKKIHLYPLVKGRILQLPGKEDLAIIHYGYSNLTEFITRQSRYSDIEAENLFEAGIRFSWFNFFWKPCREFLTRYIKHLGFLDGIHGFALTYFMIIYQLEVQIKLWELEQQK